MAKMLKPRQTKDLKLGFDRLGKKFFRNIGLNNIENALDFGSGIGSYTIPLAQILADTSKVFALDCDNTALEE